jgi:hypothetical protein
MNKSGFKYSLMVLFLTLSLMSCIRGKTESSRIFNSTKADFSILKQDCKDIEGEGDMLLGLKEIKEDTQSIFLLLEVADPTYNEDQITKLTSSISENAKKVISLSKAKWTDSKWNYETSWELTDRDFKTLLGRLFRSNSEILGMSIHSVYFMGEPREDLKKSITLKNEGNTLKVKFKGVASSLEACQLQRSLGIFLEVRFSDGKFIHSRYFNLNTDTLIMESI